MPPGFLGPPVAPLVDESLVYSADTGHRIGTAGGRYSLWVDGEEIVDFPGYHCWWGSLNLDGTRVVFHRSPIAAGSPGALALWVHADLETWTADSDGANAAALVDDRLCIQPAFSDEGIYCIRATTPGVVGLAILDPDTGAVIRHVVAPGTTNPLSDPGWCAEADYAWAAGSELRGIAETRFTIPLPAWLDAEGDHVALAREWPARVQYDPTPRPGYRWQTAYLVYDDSTELWSLRTRWPGHAETTIIPGAANVLPGPLRWRGDGTAAVVQHIDTAATVPVDAKWQVWQVNADGSGYSRLKSVLGDNLIFPSVGPLVDPTGTTITKQSVMDQAGLTDPDALTAAGSNQQTTSGTSGNPLLVQNKDFTNGLEIANGVHDVTWRNCRFRGDVGDQTVRHYNTGVGLRFENCDIGDEDTSAAIGIAKKTYLYRCDIHLSSDGLKTDGAAGQLTVVEECWIHDLRQIEGVDHSDGIQFYSSNGYTTVLHSVIEGASAAIFCGDIVGNDLVDVTVEENWLDFDADEPAPGFYITRFSRDETEGDYVNLRVIGNRFGRIGSPHGGNNGWTSGVNGCEWSGNVYDDNDEPIAG